MVDKVISNKLLDDLFKANSYTSFFKENKFSISKRVEKKVKDLYKVDIENPKFSCQYSYKRTKLDYFFLYWADEDIGKKIITSDFVVPPKWSSKKIKELVQDIFNKDKRIKVAHFYTPIRSRIHSQLLELGAVNSGYHLFGTVTEGLQYLSQYEYDKEIEVCDLKESDIEEAIELEYWAQKLSPTTRCGALPRKEIRGFFNSLIKRKRKVILAKENGKIVGIIAPSINDFKVGHIMTISVQPNEQKRGLSKLLYCEALKYLKSKKVEVYSGVSTTSEVLGLSKRMKRKPRYVYLELSRKV